MCNLNKADTYTLSRAFLNTSSPVHEELFPKYLQFTYRTNFYQSMESLTVTL
ncbi:MAG: hypothetical protein ACXVOH_04760 [Bacteroidia bacterium]